MSPKGQCPSRCQLRHSSVFLRYSMVLKVLTNFATWRLGSQRPASGEIIMPLTEPPTRGEADRPDGGERDPLRTGDAWNLWGAWPRSLCSS